MTALSVLTALSVFYETLNTGSVLLTQTGVPIADFGWATLLGQLGATGISVALMIWIYKDVTTLLREELNRLQGELAARTAKADEMNEVLAKEVAPAMSEMTRSSRQVMELLIRREERGDS